MDGAVAGVGLPEQIHFAADVAVLGGVLCDVAGRAETASPSGPISRVVNQPALHVAGAHLELATRLDHGETCRHSRRLGQDRRALANAHFLAFAWISLS